MIGCTDNEGRDTVSDWLGDLNCREIKGHKHGVLPDNEGDGGIDTFT